MAVAALLRPPGLGDSHFLLLLLTLLSICSTVSCMRLDPERIAARLRIEQEIEMDHLAKIGRNRRQLAPQKEITIQVTAPLFSSRLFEYGPDAGDQALGDGLDVGKKLQLQNPISFYGQQFSTVYVLSNGAIAFDSNAKNYRANVIPGNLKLVAPFWNRNDLRNGGHVYFREITSGRVLERGQSEIRYQYDKNMKALSCLLVTWEKMQPLGTAPLPDENTNTFQAAIFVTENGTFANFIYSNIGWTQGAEAGFSSGDGLSHFALPTSGTGNIMYLEEYGNTGIPGEWMFELSDARVIRCKGGIKGDTCDEVCSTGEWGADCAGCCHCAGGVHCHNVTGECPAAKCGDCWSGPNCQEKTEKCKNDAARPCAHNAISYTDFDRCGEPSPRCQCLAGYEGDGYKECRDVDECTQPGVCHEKATCTNTPGRFFCQCPEGFSGDGVAECTASFLFSTEGQHLPKSKNSKVAWQLKYPLKIFGQLRDRITISTNGLLTVEEKSPVKSGMSLDDMDALAIAPFFASIDLGRSGEVVVSESTDSDILSRTTQMVNENLEDGNFVATSVVTISFMNVTSTKAKDTNTFQALLIGGTNPKRESLSFVAFLYKDLMWSEGAEAGIMTLDKSNSIQLPGSGTDGIDQLSQLSNIRMPGMWLYRVDRDVVFACMQEELQPPYCDAQSPTLVSRSRSQPAITTPSSVVEDRLPPKSSEKLRPAFVVTPNTVVPEPITNELPPEAETETVTRLTPAFPVVETRAWTQAETTSTTHRPLVSLGSREFEEIPPDAFDPFPSVMTVIPEIITPPPRIPGQHVGGGSGFVQQPGGFNQQGGSFNQQPAGDDLGISFPTFPPIVPELIRPTQQQTIPPAPETTVPSQTEGVAVVVEQPVEKPPKPVPDFQDDGQGETIPVGPEQKIIPQIVRPGQHSSEVKPEPPPTQETEPPTTSPTTESTTPPTSTTTSASRLFIFTTTPKPNRLPPTKKPKLVTGPHPNNSKTPSDANVHTAGSMPFDPNRVLDPDTQGSKMAIVIVLCLVAAWLLILVFVAVFVSCQRRRTQHNLRAMYGPAYQIRPLATNFNMREKSFDTSYEDHLEKAARLSSELSSYNQGGRVSLYGSYWNLSNGSGGGVGAAYLNGNCTASPTGATNHANGIAQRSSPNLPFTTQRQSQHNGNHNARH